MNDIINLLILFVTIQGISLIWTFIRDIKTMKYQQSKDAIMRQSEHSLKIERDNVEAYRNAARGLSKENDRLLSRVRELEKEMEE